MEVYPPERQIFRLEKARQRGETISRQINPVRFRQRSPGVFRNGLDPRVAHVKSVSVGEVVSGFEKFQSAAAGEAQIVSAVSRRRFARVRQPVRQVVQCRRRTGDLERVIGRTL